MGSQLRFALALQLGSSLVFVVAAIVAGAMNRSVPVVLMLAAAMTLCGIVVKSSGRTAGLGGLMGGDAPASPWSGALQGFIGRVIGLGLIYGLTVLIAAIFRETEIEQRVLGFDVILVGVATGVALVCALVAQRIMMAQGDALQSMMAQFQSRMQEMQGRRPGTGSAANDDDIIEGDFTRKDED